MSNLEEPTLSMNKTCPISNVASEGCSDGMKFLLSQDSQFNESIPIHGIPLSVRPQLCKRCAASVRRRRSSGSRILLPVWYFSEIDSDSTQEISETRVGAEGTKLGTEHIAIK